MIDKYIDTIIGIGWLLFFVYWFASAAVSKKNIGRFGYSIKYRLILIVAVILIIRVSRNNTPHFGYTDFTAHNQALVIIGACLFIAGLSYAIWARIYLGKNWGMPMTRKEKPELVISGPYAYARHPIYTGMLIAWLGTALAVSFYWLLFLVISAFYFMYSAKHEEAYLRQQFPESYPAYMKRTKMLLPFIF